MTDHTPASVPQKEGQPLAHHQAPPTAVLRSLVVAAASEPRGMQDLAAETGVARSALIAFRDGGGIKGETVDRLCERFGLRLTVEEGGGEE